MSEVYFSSGAVERFHTRNIFQTLSAKVRVFDAFEPVKEFSRLTLTAVCSLLWLAACNDKQAPLVNVAIYGDSIVALMSGNQLTPPFDTALNQGIAGNSATQIADRVQPIGRIVFIEGGINSLGIAQDPNPIEVSYGRILAKLATVQVRVIGILRVDEAALPPELGQLTNAKIAAANAKIIAVCKQYPNCAVVTDAMNMDMAGLTDGGIHPKPEAYKAITAVLARYAQ